MMEERDTSSAAANLHDLIRVGEHVYEVTGIHLAGGGQESLVALRCVSSAPGAAFGQVFADMMVPEPLLRAALTTGAALSYRLA